MRVTQGESSSQAFGARVAGLRHGASEAMSLHQQSSAQTSMATSRSSTRYTTLEALALHEAVPPDRWCVTRADLQYMRQEVRQAIDDGEIRPPECGSDNFQASDTHYGPSIYTVNKQHIMPVTEQAGKISWALMRHPDGLECDLFISHAWQEGVFEFLSKVLHSWPRDARHAWCCMLANPQNLDIGKGLQKGLAFHGLNH